jgi:hypothetical protein
MNYEPTQAASAVSEQPQHVDCRLPRWIKDGSLEERLSILGSWFPEDPRLETHPPTLIASGSWQEALIEALQGWNGPLFFYEADDAIAQTQLASVVAYETDARIGNPSFILSRYKLSTNELATIGMDLLNQTGQLEATLCGDLGLRNIPDGYLMTFVRKEGWSGEQCLRLVSEVDGADHPSLVDLDAARDAAKKAEAEWYERHGREAQEAHTQRLSTGTLDATFLVTGCAGERAPHQWGWARSSKPVFQPTPEEKQLRERCGAIMNQYRQIVGVDKLITLMGSSLITKERFYSVITQLKACPNNSAINKLCNNAITVRPIAEAVSGGSQ